MKEKTKPENQDNFLELIIKDISTKNRWLDFELLARIYIAEEWLGRLLEMIKQDPSFKQDRAI